MTEEKMFNTGDYELPMGEEVIVDAANDEIIDKDSLTPFDKIKSVAAEQGIEIQEPKSNCKHCRGRGYVSVESKSQMPIPCRCIFNEEQREQLSMVPLKKNRKQLRLQEKMFRKQITRAKLGKSPTKKAKSKRKKR